MKSNEKQCNAKRSKAKQRKAGRTVTCASSSPAHPKAMQSNAKQYKAMQIFLVGGPKRDNSMFDALAAPKWGGSPTLSAKPAFLPFAPQQLAAILGKNLAPPPLNPPSREGIYLHRNYLVMQSPLQFSAWHLEHSCIADTCKTKAASSIRRLPSWLAAVNTKSIFF